MSVTRILQGNCIDTPALDKLLEHHARTCTFWIFSGDRHCSCGRDEALQELEQLKCMQSIPVQPILSAMPVHP